MTDPILVTVPEAAQMLSLSITKTYELVAAGMLSKRYVGSRNFRLLAREVRAYAENLPTEPTG